MAQALTKRVLKATSLLGSTQIMSMLFSLVRMKLLSIWVGELGVGLSGALTQTSDFIGNLSQLGMRTTAVRDLAGAPPSRRSDVLICIRRYGLLLGLVGTAFLFLFAPALANFTLGSREFTWAFRISALAIVLNSLFGSEAVVLQAFGEYKAIASRAIISSLSGLIIALPLYYFFRANGVPFAIVGYALSAWVTILYLSRRYRSLGAKPSWRSSLALGRGFISVGIILTVTSLVTEGLNLALLGFIGQHGEVALGHFQAGYTMLWRYFGVFFVAFSVEFYPRLSRVAGKPRAMQLMLTHQTVVFTLIALPVIALAIAIAPWLIRLLFRESFMPMLPYFVWGMTGMALRPLSFSMSYSFLAANRGKIFAVTEVASSLIGFALNIAGYSLAGFAGLGLAVVVWLYIDLTIILLAAKFCATPLPRPRAVILAYIAPLPLLLLATAI